MLQFQDIADNLDQYLKQTLNELNKSDFIDVNNIKNINGIYVFYDNETPIYVGRTNNMRMRDRIKEHSRKSSNKNSATFAFLIAKKNTNKNDFKAYDNEFTNAKEQVSKMRIKIIEVNDPIIQTILEPYIAFHLDTISGYNSFRAH